MVSALVTMTFAGIEMHLMHRSGVRGSSLWDFDETRRIIVREHNEE